MQHIFEVNEDSSILEDGLFIFKDNHIQYLPLYLLMIWIRANIDKPVDLALKNVYLKFKPPEILKSQETSF